VALLHLYRAFHCPFIPVSHPSLVRGFGGGLCWLYICAKLEQQFDLKMKAENELGTKDPLGTVCNRY